MRFTLCVSAIAVFIATVSTASASLQLNSLGVEDSVPNSGNDFNSDLTNLSFDSILRGTITATASGTVSFYYHASESGQNNQFLANGGVGANSVDFTESSNKSWDAMGVLIGSISVSAGEVLNLTFDSNNGAPHAIGTSEFGIFADDANGTFLSNLNDPLGGRAYFGHDDNGAGLDDNHDDIVISAQFAAIPEPSSFLFFGAVSTLVACRPKRR